MNTSTKVLVVISLLMQLVAAVLFFVSITGYSLLEYYHSAVQLPIYYPGITLKKLLFYLSLIIATVCTIIKWIINRNFKEVSPSETPKTISWIGIVGFIHALLALVLFWTPTMGKVLWVIGWIFSYFGVHLRPRGLAIAGVVVSMDTLALWMVIMHFV